MDDLVKSNFDKMKIEAILPILIKEYSDVFPNIIRLIKIAYTVPFSSVPCEREFSKQKQTIEIVCQLIL